MPESVQPTEPGRVTDSAARPWDWRLALNHGLFDVDRRPTFHAYDVNHNAACEPCFGLVRSIEQPNEGSFLCPECMVVVRRQPHGRAKREARSA